MQTNKTIWIMLVISMWCFITPFSVYPGDNPEKGYFLSAKSRAITYRLFVNGFLVSAEHGIIISYYLRPGTNNIVVDVLRYEKGINPTIMITIDRTMIRKKNEPGVLTWDIAFNPSKTRYEKQFDLKGLEQAMPWEKAEQIRELSDSDREKVKKIAMDYVEVLISGKTESLKKFFSSRLKWRMSAESEMKGVSQDTLIKQFLFFYEGFWSPTSRKSVTRAKETDLTVFKSPLNDKVVIVTTMNDKPILKIVSGMMSDEEKSELGSHIDLEENELFFIKMDGDWYIY